MKGGALIIFILSGRGGRREESPAGARGRGGAIRAAASSSSDGEARLMLTAHEAPAAGFPLRHRRCRQMPLGDADCRRAVESDARRRVENRREEGSVSIIFLTTPHMESIHPLCFFHYIFVTTSPYG